LSSPSPKLVSCKGEGSRHIYTGPNAIQNDKIKKQINNRKQKGNKQNINKQTNKTNKQTNKQIKHQHAAIKKTYTDRLFIICP